MGQDYQFSKLREEAEWFILRYLKMRGKATTPEIYEYLFEQFGLSYYSAKKLLRKMKEQRKINGRLVRKAHGGYVWVWSAWKDNLKEVKR